MLLRLFILLACLTVTGCGGHGKPDPDPDNSSPPLPSAEMAIQRLDHASFRFTAARQSPPLSYHWDMGDGQMLEGSTIEYSYASTGAFNVTLTLSNPLGETDSVTRRAHVRNRAPEANYDVRFNQLDLTLDATMSVNVNGIIGAYEWLINGQSYTGPQIELSLMQPDNLYIELTVTDTLGESSEVLEDTIPVTGDHNSPPEPVIDVLAERNYVHLIGSGSMDADQELFTFHRVLIGGSE